ncbi:MAG: hypothetical protein HGA80_03775 [Candidatus Omnitrophica bacterium]|nr:hypothetical protein [Candidatus Omnitrophota bacterium]
MKNVIYVKRDLVERGRVISIREQHADKDSSTRVMKNFVYLISREDAIPEEMDTPEVRVVKKITAEDKSEVFVFKVKGHIYVKEKRFIYKVQYCHSLCVHMIWKTHVLSTKPVALA